MKAVNEKITIELSIRELELLDLALSIAQSEYWTKYSKAGEDSREQKSYLTTFNEINKLDSEISHIKYGD